MQHIKPEEINLQLEKQNIQALRWRNGTEPTLCLHGWLDNAASFSLLAPLLPLDCVAVDLPGHGLSSKLNAYKFHNTIDYVHDVAEILAKLEWKKFNIIAHSMGAVISLLFCGAFPEQINKLILLDNIGELDDDNDKNPKRLRDATIQSLTNSKRSPVYQNIEQAIQARINSKVGSLDKTSAKLLVTRGTLKTEQGIIWRNDPKVAHTKPINLTFEQLKPFLQQITAKTLLIKPDNGYYLPIDELQRRATLFQDLTIVNIHGEHHVHMDNANLVAEHINKFLQAG